jgi:hypothetical protein
VGVFRDPPQLFGGGEHVCARITGLGELTCTIGERER